MNVNLIGTWQLKGCTQRTVDGQEHPDPLDDATGFIIYDKHRMSVQIMTSNYKQRLAENISDSSLKQLQDAFNGYVAYFGPYSFNPETSVVSHHVQGSWLPCLINKTLDRKVEFVDERTVVFSNVEPEAYIDKDLITRFLTWKKCA